METFLLQITTLNKRHKYFVAMDEKLLDRPDPYARRQLYTLVVAGDILVSMEYTDSSSSFNGWLEKRPRQAPKVHTLTMVIGASWRKARSGNEGVAALLKLMHETLPQSQPQAQPAHAA